MNGMQHRTRRKQNTESGGGDVTDRDDDDDGDDEEKEEMVMMRKRGRLGKQAWENQFYSAEAQPPRDLAQYSTTYTDALTTGLALPSLYTQTWGTPK
jgi:hypothetical protein